MRSYEFLSERKGLTALRFAKSRQRFRKTKRAFDLLLHLRTLVIRFYFYIGLPFLEMETCLNDKHRWIYASEIYVIFFNITFSIVYLFL